MLADIELLETFLQSQNAVFTEPWYALGRIKTALAELGTTPNTGSPKLFLLQLRDVLSCKDCSDIEKLAGARALVSEQLRAKRPTAKPDLCKGMPHGSCKGEA